jgi:hypothetical protein
MKGARLKPAVDDDGNDGGDDGDVDYETQRFLPLSSMPQQQQQQSSSTMSSASSLHSPPTSPTSPRLRRTAATRSASSTSSDSTGALSWSPLCRGDRGESTTTTTATPATAATTPPPLRFFCCFGQVFLKMLPDRVSRNLRPAQKRRLRNAVSVICCLFVFAMIVHNTIDESRRIPNIIIDADQGTSVVKRIGENMNKNDDDLKNDDVSSSSNQVTDDLEQTHAVQDDEEKRPGDGISTTKPKLEKVKDLLPAYAHVDPPPMSSKYNYNASQHFVERWCDLDEKNGVDWFPKGNKLWQRRAPAFLIPGAKFAGTDLLVHYLQTTAPYRDAIVPPTFHHELSFFFDPRFQKYVTPNEQKTRVKQARERLYAKFYNIREIRQQRPDAVSFDASSGYLFYSTLLPRRIFCVMPWVRLVILLRNPTDRLFHHYREAQKKGLRLSFEEWIDKDFRLLHDAGFFQLNSTTATTTSSSTSSSSTPWSESTPITNMTLQDIAWFQYQQQSLEGAVGRSLYEVQLRQWFQALRAIGRKPSKSVLIVWSHDLIRNPQAELKRVAQFLQLVVPPANSSTIKASTTTAAKTAALIAQINATTLSTGMNSQTRQRLDDFFRPYNMRLRANLQRFEFPPGAFAGG